MRGFSQIVLEENAAALDERSVDHLQRISNSARQMGELIDALLDFSRLTRLGIKREEVDLSWLARDVAAHLQSAEPRRNVHFEVQDDIKVHADKRLMRLVLENLLGNAWKFTSKNDRAVIVFGSGTREGQRFFFVRDDGAGFDMNYAGKLFGAFQRLHHPDEFPGHGAGLAITKRIIQKHGGQIWAEGTVGRGATFYFTLA
jgi:light-regulated signal transduction histidine kinase (bacteriophytochrome)